MNRWIRQVLTAVALWGCGAALALADAPWGRPNKEGIVTRVVPLQEEYRLGTFMPFRIEAKNTGNQLVYADLQTFAHCWSLLNVLDGQGMEVEAIGAKITGCQTIQAYTAFPPGEVVSLVPRGSLSGEFAILEPGTYRLKYPGEKFAPPKFDVGEAVQSVEGEKLDASAVFTELPASEFITIEVKPGELTPEEAMIKALRPVVPRGWFLCRRWRDRGVTIGFQDEVAEVAIDLVAVDPRQGGDGEDGHQPLGRGAVGEIRMGVTIGEGRAGQEAPPNACVEDFWPGAEGEIKQALEIGIPEA